MMWTVIVTRPEPHNGRLCQLLDNLGYQTVALPLLEVTPCPFEGEDPSAARLRGILTDIDRYDGVICVSQAASEWLAQGLDYFWPQPPMGLLWWAMGKSSAEPLIQLGLDVNYAASGYNSEALLAEPSLAAERVAHKRYLLLKGTGGRALLRHELTRRGALITEESVYQTDIAPLAPKTCADLQQNVAVAGDRPGGLITTVTSLRALSALSDLLQRPETSAAVAQQVRTSALVVISDRIADAARQQGFRHIVNTSGPDNASIVSAIEELKHAK